MKKQRLLIMVDWFAPAYKAGGPIQSCVNLAYSLAKHYEIFVLTGDKDLGERNSMPNIVLNTWIDFADGIKVCYATPENRTYSAIKLKISDLAPDFIYANMTFSLPSAVFPIMLKWRNIYKGKIILAPRGTFKSTALAIKPLKKKVFITAFKVLGWDKRITFQATDAQEIQDTKALFGEKTRVLFASNLPKMYQSPWLITPKSVGELKMVFVGRIHPIKNIAYLLDSLRFVKGKVHLDLYGAMEDTDYWEKCKKIIADFPKEIEVHYKGEVANVEIHALMKNYHFLAMPTLGENFGHAIFEGLQAGKPLLITNTTPWQSLENQEIGWDVPLNMPEKYGENIQKAIEMSAEKYEKWSKNAWQFAHDFMANPALIADYLKLFS
jgi:glycosyltransferase involved in cell wall biosynthesis